MAFDYEAAKAGGYSDREIADYLAKQNKFDIEGARKSGYNDQEILNHLAPKAGIKIPVAEPEVAVPAVTQTPATAAVPSIIQATAETAPMKWLADQAQIIRDDLKVGAKNTNIAVQNAKLAAMMEIQEARLAKHGSIENMPEDTRKEYVTDQKAIEKILLNVGESAAEIRGVQKTGAQRESTAYFHEMQQSPEYKNGDFMTKLGMTGEAIMRDPIGISVDLGLQSLPQSMAVAASALAARVGMLNPKMAAAAGGTSSAMMEFGNQYADMRASGMPHEEAWQKAAVKAGVIGLFDAASFGSAGKAAGVVMNDLKRGAVANTVKEVAKETGKQSLYGAAGEALGSAAAGQDIDPAQVAAEAIGEVFGAPAEAVSTYQAQTRPAEEAIPTAEEAAKAKGFLRGKTPDEKPVSELPTNITIYGEPAPESAKEEPARPAPESETMDLGAMLAELSGQPVQMEKSEVPVEKEPAPKEEEVKPADAQAVIQNRNRATPASVSQMNQIANKLDYDLVKYSPTLADGAPVVAGNVAFPPELLGRQDIVTASDGSKIPVQYAVVSAQDVLPSNNVDGSTNKAFFDPNYQGLKAIAGNARTAGIQAAYDRGNAGDYAARLMADDMHGIDPAVVSSIQNPMLVRLMPPEYVTKNIGDISNVASNLELSTVEQAKNDANRVDMLGLNFDDNGNITMNTMRGFIAAMPQSELSKLVDDDGSPTKQAYNRIEAAIFSKAYNSDELVRLAFQAKDEEARNIINAAAKAAPQMMRLEGAGEYDIRNIVVQAMEKAISARRDGVSLQEAARQPDIAIDPLANRLVQMFADHARSAKAISTRLIDFANEAYKESQIPAEGLFGETPKRPAAEIAEAKMAPEEAQPELLGKAATPGELDNLAQDLHSVLLDINRAIDKPAKDVPSIKALRKEIDAVPVNESRKRLADAKETLEQERERIDREGKRITYGWKGSKFSSKIDEFITTLYGLDDEAYALKYDREMSRKHKAGELKTVDDVAKDVRERIQNLRDKREEEIVAGKQPHPSAVEPEDVEKYKSFAEELMGKGKRTEDVKTVTKNGKEYDQWTVKIVSNLSQPQAKFWLENFGDMKEAVLVDEPRNYLTVMLADTKKSGVQPGRKYTMNWSATVEHVPEKIRAEKMREIYNRMQELGKKTKAFPGTNYDYTLDQITAKYRMASLASIDADIKRLDNSLKRQENLKAKLEEELWRGTEFEGRIDKMLTDLRESDAASFARMLNASFNRDVETNTLTEESVEFRENSVRKELARLGKRKPVEYEPMTLDKLLNSYAEIQALPAEIQKAAVDQWNSVAPKLYEMGFKFRETQGSMDMEAKELDKQLRDIPAYLKMLAGRRYENAVLESRKFKTDDARVKAIQNSEKKLAEAEAYAADAIGFDTARYPGVDTSRPMDVYGDYTEAIKPESISFVSDEKFWDSQKAKETRDQKIAEYAGLRISKAAAEKRFVEGKMRPLDESLYKLTYNRAAKLKQEIADSYVPNTTPENFLANAARQLANGSISQETYDAIDTAFRNHPNLLDGLRLSVRQKKGEGSKTTGNFDPLEKIVTLFKETDGTENPAVIRHELTHGMEQMMPEKARLAVVNAWIDALEKAVKAEKSPAGKAFFEKVNEFIEKPSNTTLKAAVGAMPNISYYQYINPSEYWAVNAEKLLHAQMGGAWQRFKSAIKMWYQGLRKVFGASNTWAVNRVFRDILNNERMETSMMLNDYVSMAVDLNSFGDRKNYEGKDAPLSDWTSPDDSKADFIIQNMQDKHIDLKHVIKNIEEGIEEVEDTWHAYRKEELYHGRASERTKEFLNKEILPILREMKANDISAQQFDDYLHNRHAEERNIQIAEVNPEMPDGGSGIMTDDAIAYLDSIPADRRKILESLALKVDKIVQGTQKILVDEGLEEPSTIKAWNKTYKHYVPLQRDDIEFIHEGGTGGTGKGYGVRGSSSKRAVGSTKSVIDVFANVAIQRERAISKAEKSRVGRAVMGLAVKYPNPDFWMAVNPEAVKNKGEFKRQLVKFGLDEEDAANFIQEPKHPEIDPKTGLVTYKVRSYLRNSENVFPVRVNGKNWYVFFNASNPVAKRMALSLRNFDADQLNIVLNIFGKFSRWTSAVNTQYNPVFGIWNFMRDFKGAAYNLSTTPIAGKQAQVMKGTFPALLGMWSYMRDERDGKTPSGPMADLIRSYKFNGGQTGYADQFVRDKNAANLIEEEMAKLNRGSAKKLAFYFFNILSDYNDMMENAVRISAYKVALDQGLSEDKAASVAKNLTVNFNRKGAKGPQMNALYAFFNAGMQGIARTFETLRGPAGKKIIAGGIAIGVVQSMMLMAAGFGDDDPSEFIKEKNFCIPVGNGRYVMIPYPLGYNVFPNIGRLTTEAIIYGNPVKRMYNLMGTVISAFNPLGSGDFMQTLMPTLVDPFLAWYSNRDAFGRPIYREDTSNNQTPGYLRSRESTMKITNLLAEFLNYVSSGGSKYQKGFISPTADEIEFFIGQFTGGAGREVMKASVATKALISGDELPPYKVPLAGKLLGNAGSPASISNQFYENVRELSQIEHEIEGRRANRENAEGYRAKHPEASLITTANRLEVEINKINKDIRDLTGKPGKDAQIKRLRDQKTRMMKQFNDRYRSLTK